MLKKKQPAYVAASAAKRLEAVVVVIYMRNQAQKKPFLDKGKISTAPIG